MSQNKRTRNKQMTPVNIAPAPPQAPPHPPPMHVDPRHMSRSMHLPVNNMPHMNPMQHNTPRPAPMNVDPNYIPHSMHMDQRSAPRPVTQQRNTMEQPVNKSPITDPIPTEQLERQLNKICPRFRELEAILGDPATFPPGRPKKKRKRENKRAKEAIVNKVVATDGLLEDILGQEENSDVVSVIREEGRKTRELLKRQFQELSKQELLKPKLDIMIEKAKLFKWSEERVEYEEKKIWEDLGK